MGFLDRLFGRDDSSQQYGRQYGQPQYGQPQYGQEPPYARQGQQQPARSEDEIAIERYRYLLRTAPPETIEQVHAEAFAKLTPEQRRMVFEELQNGPDRPLGDDPQSLARSATRSEIRQPGFLEQRLGGGGGRGGFGGVGGPSFGSMLGASLLGTVAGYVVGSALMSAFLPPMDYAGADMAGADGGDGGDGGDSGDAGGDSGGDVGGDAGGGDWGGGGDGGFFGGGDFGGGFGGGDFGGDFGGGDF